LIREWSGALAQLLEDAVSVVRRDGFSDEDSEGLVVEPYAQDLVGRVAPERPHCDLFRSVREDRPLRIGANVMAISLISC
jgi:hypothetical protein